MEIRKIGIVGAGTMGNGIAQVVAMAGIKAVVSDIDESQLQRGLATISNSLDRLIKKEVITPDQKKAATSLIATTTELDKLSECELIIEAASENLDLKLKIFSQLDKIAAPATILASNTSSISITLIAASTGRADKVIGMHFFNPVPMMSLIELIRGLQTSDATYAQVEELTRTIGKQPVQVRNSPGFVVNRLLCPMLNEAIFTLGEGLATADEIDEAMKLGANHPIGPLALADMIGLDVQLAVMQVLFNGFKDPKYRPAPLLVEMVEAGYLGRKSGQGFFDYREKG